MGIPIKTPEEIELMRHAGSILHDVLLQLQEAAKPGVSTLELDELAEKLITSRPGCTPGFKGYHGFPGSICASVNDEVVHGIPDEKHVLKGGDIIGIDCGVFYEGFHTDACLTVPIGEVDPEVMHFVKTTKKALDKAIKVVKPGARVGDISQVIQKTLELQGFSAVAECTGHGVGRNLHEEPEIMNIGRAGTGPELKPGMVLAIEPISTMGGPQIVTLDDNWTIVTADRTLSAHFEHTIVVTDNGHDVLT